MEKIYSENDLNRIILQLESKQTIEAKLLKEQFYLTYESLKPINIIKNIFKQASESQEIKENIINSSVGLTAGYLSKILFETVANSPLKKLVGSVVMFSVKNAVAHNPVVIKLLLNGFLKIISSKKPQ
ncbi:MAG: hypothetical protein NDI80_02390 [Flavobacteriaceae bacterium]|jgi:hypothetical protein|nr:hypothetical protein [Flavobacteriaceae bacterium]